MFDLINTNVKDRKKFENYLENSTFIDLTNSINTITGEILEYPKKGSFHNINIRINKLFSKLVGSLHKLNNIMFRNEDQNYNDFTYEELSSLLPYFIDKFDLENNNHLTKLELGFNIKVDFDPQKIIDNNLLMYDYKNHNRNKVLNGDFKEFFKSDYSLKIYNKSRQYKKKFDVKDHILRIELKLTSKRKIQSFGINCLEDLLDKDRIYKVFQFLQKEFQKLTIVDNVDFEKFPQKDLDKLNKYTNPNYWNALKTQNKSYKVQARLKKDFNLFLKKHQLDNLKVNLENKLSSKFWELINQNESELFKSKSD
ncbi:hypothetical protein [Flavobacterium sp. HBTb2-11-1]|uniref:hypothetical protein n=1 Tax=Flavobacterium sp. HBTb2-11-1 TaxID=2692212 RepID=UPI00136EF94B|nr:hypothetical protein [Flavobacterium sp. HBTb2-11-1]MXO06169.1 hypothetical protein [Flavobacterium sp. HBTb2-11-1]